MKKRNPLKFIVNNSNTDRYKKSTIPSMQRMLNEEARKFSHFIKKLDDVCAQRSLSNDFSLRNFTY